MKIALVQFDIIFEDIRLNLEKARQQIAEAAKNQAELIIFPEMSFTGFSMNVEKVADSDGVIREQMKVYAREYQVYIGFGWVEQANNTQEPNTQGYVKEKGWNRFSILSPKGDTIYNYTKIHPFSYAKEDEYYIAGDSVSIGTIGEVTFSAFICYDLRFPEVFQCVSKDSSLIFVVANWPKERREHWLTLLKARAIENQVYIAGINCVGTQGKFLFSGDSCFINPNGEILSTLSNEEGILYLDFTDDILWYRNRFTTLKDRREMLYPKL